MATAALTEINESSSATAISAAMATPANWTIAAVAPPSAVAVASALLAAVAGACAVVLLALACAVPGRRRHRPRLCPAAAAAAAATATAASGGDASWLQLGGYARVDDDEDDRTGGGGLVRQLIEGVKRIFSAFRTVAHFGKDRLQRRSRSGDRRGESQIEDGPQPLQPLLGESERRRPPNAAVPWSEAAAASADVDGERSLETEEAAAASASGGDEFVGTLRYSLVYRETDETLTVRLLAAADLRSPPPSGQPLGDERLEPYVKLLLLPAGYEAKTRAIRGASDPEFDEAFTLCCHDPAASVIRFTVCSHDRYSRDLVLGEATCALADVELPADLETFLQSPIVSRFNQMLQQSPGELLVSLSYQHLAHRLVVTILKARNLPLLGCMSSTTDTFVSICLLYNAQVIALRATQVKAGEANPVYNETFLFDLPISERLDKIAIVAKVCGCSSTTRCEPIGWLEISERTPIASQHYHWQQTTVKPGRHVAQWHRLTPGYGYQ